MIQSLTQKIISQLKKKDLSLLDRSALVSAVLSKLHALPLNDSIVIGQGSITINGKALETEQIISFRESAIALRDNWARKILHEQVRYLATTMGVYKSVSIDELYFYKSALWNLEQEDALLDQLI